MKMKKNVLIVFWVICLLLSACGNSGQEAQNSKQLPEESDVETKTLRVLMPGSYQDSGIHGPVVQIGGMDVTNEFIYAGLLELFEEQSGVHVEIDYSYDGLDNLANQTGRYDLIICTNRSSRVALSSALTADNCYDMSSLFTEKELYNGDYVTPILEAGKVEGKQLVFPLTFNLSMLYSSEESLERHNLNITTDSSFDELAESFMDCWVREQDTIPLYQMRYGMGNTFGFSSVSPFHTFLYAAENRNHQSPDFYLKLISLYRSFLEADFNMELDEIRSWIGQEKTHSIVPVGEQNSLSYTVDLMMQNNAEEAFDFFNEKIACFASGTVTGYFIPFAVQSMFYETLYEKAGETFFLTAIPEENNSSGYEAVVTMYGVIPQKAENPETAFQLLTFLADAKINYLYDMPVNKNQIKESLAELKQRKIQLSSMFGTASCEIGPMSEATADYLESVIEHIESAGFRDNATEEELYAILESFVLGEIDEQQAALQMGELRNPSD